MGIPSMGNRSDAQVHKLREMSERYKDTIELVYPKKLAHRMFHDHARNKTVEEFLASDCDIMWFLDSDVVPHDFALDLVVKHQDKWKLAGLPYPVMMTPAGESTPQIVFTVYKNLKEKQGMGAASIPKEGIDFVDGIATGCIFIKREVLEKLDKPYFKFVYNEENRDIVMGEDLDFCFRVSKLGYKFFIDYEKVCRHFKTVDLLDVNNYAIDFVNKSMGVFEANIRSQLSKFYIDKKFRRNDASPASPVIRSGEKTPGVSGKQQQILGTMPPSES